MRMNKALCAVGVGLLLAVRADAAPDDQARYATGDMAAKAALIYSLIYESERCDHEASEAQKKRCRDNAVLLESEIHRFLQSVAETGVKLDLRPYLKRWEPVFGLKGSPGQ